MAQLLGSVVQPITIEEEMQKSYLDYAMSVIVARALPDVRDGLKPVHRRILYGQSRMSNDWNKKHIKSAKVVGEVMGNYHPHGDSAIYDALVRMAQDFSMRLPLEDGQGNFGSMGGDNAAAMRYTEIRLSKAGSSILADLDENTVDFKPTYDGSGEEPMVLPSRIPNVLVNGSGGIAVGMATNIPPHNLGEVVDACLHLIDNPEATLADLAGIVKGPDFPTGGIIMGRKGVADAFASGRGSVQVRARTNIENPDAAKPTIVISEVPYQVNTDTLIKSIADLVKDKIVEDISEVREETNRQGLRIVVELKRGANPEVILNQLYKHTQLQSNFAYNMVVLDRGLPRLYGLPEILKCFVQHREEVVGRRTRFRLGKARERAHVLVGLGIAVANIDEVIKIIREAADPATAKELLMARKWPAKQVTPLLELLGDKVDMAAYLLSAIQAQAILDLRLHRLTGLERDKILDEAGEIAESIRGLLAILSDRAILLGVVKDELNEVKDQFATPRLTSIEDAAGDVNLEDLIQPEDVVVTISSDGYVKRVPLATFRAQRRGGKGKAAANLRENESMSNLFVANTHSPVLFFTNLGNVFKLKVYELPVATATSRGKAFVNLLPLAKDEQVAAVVPLPRDEAAWQGHYLLFATKLGAIRKTPLAAYSNVRTSGIYGMGLNDGDQLMGVHLISGGTPTDVLISSQNGQAVRFSAGDDDLRAIASRTSTGVKGMNLRDKDEVMAMHPLTVESHVLTVTANGYGKLTPSADYPQKGRGTMGVISIQTTDRNGKVVCAVPVNRDDDQIMIATEGGQLIRMNVGDISEMGRNTQGVRLFSTDGDKVKLVTRLSAAMLGKEEDGEGEVVETTAPLPIDDAEQPEGKGK